MTSSEKHQYYCNCVNWPMDDVDSDNGLCAMIDAATDISRATFMSRVDRAAREAIEADLGYAARRRDGLVIADDYHVSYHRSMLHGRRCYYLRHSAIEYVFTPDGKAA